MPDVGRAGVTLLWALRSKCDLGCRYCYFGTIEDHRVQAPLLFEVRLALRNCAQRTGKIAGSIGDFTEGRTKLSTLPRETPLL